MNTENTFTCIGKGGGFNNPVFPATRTDVDRMRRDPQLAEKCRLILEGNDKLKNELPYWTPHCALYRNNHRANEDALRPLQRLMMDIDVKGKSREILARAMELHRSGRWHILLVEESVRKGVHILIALPEGMSAQEAQRRFSADLGYPVDPAVKDLARAIFFVPKAYVLYEDEALYEPLEAVPADESQVLPEPVAKVAESHAPADDGMVYPTEFKGVPYDDIIREWFVHQQGMPQPGERNTKLFRLATHLRSIVDNNEAHLLQIMPRFGLSEGEMKAIIHHACTGKVGSTSKVLNRIVSILQAEQTADAGADEPEVAFFYRSTPPAIPRTLPSLIAHLVSCTPDIYIATVAQSVFPALGAHLWKVSFRYIDNKCYEATLMNVVMAETGAGKSCINEPINRIMADIRERDKRSLQREKEWKIDCQSKSANKDKKKRPEGIVVQEVSPDITPAAFLMRMAEADGRFLFARMNELDRLDAIKLNGKGDTQFQIICLAFDADNEFGADRVGIASVNERVKLRFNFVAATTIGKGQAYFRKVLTDGPVSRINFCTIPESPIGADIPVYGTYDEEFDEKLRPYIQQLTDARGLIECIEARELAQRLKQEMADVAILTQNRVFDTLSRRALVIAYLKACVLYVANGCQWEDSMDEFIRWSLKYDLWCKMHFFGEAIARAEEVVMTPSKPGPSSLLDLLPDTFSREEANQMRQREGLTTGSTQSMLDTWKHRKYIEPVGEKTADRARQRFAKTEYYIRKFVRKEG